MISSHNIFVFRYRNGIWEFNNSGKDIHREFYHRFGEFENMHIQRSFIR